MTTELIGMPTTAAAATRIYEIRRLFHAGVVLRDAALLSLSALRLAHPHERIKRLCERVAEDIDQPFYHECPAARARAAR